MSNPFHFMVTARGGPRHTPVYQTPVTIAGVSDPAYAFVEALRLAQTCVERTSCAAYVESWEIRRIRTSEEAHDLANELTVKMLNQRSNK